MGDTTVKRYINMCALALAAIMLMGVFSSCGEIKIPEIVDDILSMEYELIEFESEKETYGSTESESEYEEEENEITESGDGIGESESIDHDELPPVDPNEPDEPDPDYPDEPYPEETQPGESESTETPEVKDYRERILLVTDFHYAKDWYGVDKDTRMKRMVDHINMEHETDPLTMIIFMGDYSLDHWAWDRAPWYTYLNTGVSMTQQFIEKYRDSLPDVPMFWLAGNHEQFGEENWQSIVGNSREGYEVIQDYLIIMWDSYGGNLDPTKHHDGVYTPIDTDWVRGLMEQYPDKKVILISHYFNSSTEKYNSADLISDDRVVALFVGHEHHSSIVELGPTYGDKSLIFAGNYSYGDTETDPGDAPWGFRDLVLEHDRVSSDYIIPENTMVVNGDTVSVGYKKEKNFTVPVYW